jgi:flagellar protein FlbT
MSGALKVSLKAGERIYLNGAVLKADRKVTLEFLNKVTFLLEHHVMQAEDTDTPLKQLYFVVQMMLIEPKSGESARGIARDMFRQLAIGFENREILESLAEVSVLVDTGRPFDALRVIRRLLPIEARIFGGDSAPPVRETDDSCRLQLR